VDKRGRLSKTNASSKEGELKKKAKPLTSPVGQKKVILVPLGDLDELESRGKKGRGIYGGGDICLREKNETSLQIWGVVQKNCGPKKLVQFRCWAGEEIVS